MALIICACYDTESNGRSEYTEQTLRCLMHTVDLGCHRLVVIDNGSCQRTKDMLQYWSDRITVITNETNVGTANAVNMGIRLREPGQHVIKIDNDVVVHSNGWVDEMEEAIERSPDIGVLGLKRKDLIQCQDHADPNFRSYPMQLPHESGQRWIWVERTNDVMGTCTMLNWRMLDKVGYYFQGDWKYGMDDTLMNLRAHLSGFTTCFLPHIDMDHIDTGRNPYTQEKHRMAAEVWSRYNDTHDEFVSGIRPIYYDGGFE